MQNPGGRRSSSLEKLEGIQLWLELRVPDKIGKWVGPGRVGAWSWHIWETEAS